MKKRTIAVILTIIGLLSCLSCFAQFGDVSPRHWAYSAIQKLEKQKIVSGYPDGSFRPDNSVSRAEYAKIFASVFGFDVRTAQEYSPVAQYLPDTDMGSWYYPYICAVLPCMFTHPDGFCPDGEMTREDAAHSLAVLYGYITPSSGTSIVSEVSDASLAAFTDAAQITAGKQESVALAIQNSFMQGKGNGIFDPLGPLTRAEICTLLTRALDNKGAPPAAVLTRLQSDGYMVVYEPVVSAPPVADTPPSTDENAPYYPFSPVPTAPDFLIAMEHQVWEITNEERAKAGLPALQYDENLAEVARVHSIDMDVRGFFDHNNPDGQSPFDRMSAAGYRYSHAAENIAWNQRSAEEVMRAWMNSPGHRANILNKNVSYVGVGLHIAGDGSYYWTQNFFSPLP